jgi:hypothetical protein
MDGTRSMCGSNAVTLSRGAPTMSWNPSPCQAATDHRVHRHRVSPRPGRSPARHDRAQPLNCLGRGRRHLPRPRPLPLLSGADDRQAADAIHVAGNEDHRPNGPDEPERGWVRPGHRSSPNALRGQLGPRRRLARVPGRGVVERADRPDGGDRLDFVQPTAAAGVALSNLIGFALCGEPPLER